LSDNLKDVVLGMAKSTIENVVKAHTAEELEEEWDLEAIVDYVEANLLPEGRVNEEDLENKEPDEMIQLIYDEVEKYYEEKQAEMGDERLQEFSKVVILRTVDRKWMDHIDAMEQLRQGIHLRAYGQDTPLRAYQFEGFAMFEEMAAISGGMDEGEAPKKQPVRRVDKIGRNDPCPCGSGKKYKNCCLKNEKVVPAGR
jgi:preprotein translocase subunit SecA